MKSTHLCPKCQSRRFLVTGEFKVPDQDSTNGIEPFPPFTMKTGPYSRDCTGKFETWICAGCGFTEWYAVELQGLDPTQSEGNVRFVDAGAPPGPAYR